MVFTLSLRFPQHDEPVNSVKPSLEPSVNALRFQANCHKYHYLSFDIWSKRKMIEESGCGHVAHPQQHYQSHSYYQYRLFFKCTPHLHLGIIYRNTRHIDKPGPPCCYVVILCWLHDEVGDGKRSRAPVTPSTYSCPSCDPGTLPLAIPLLWPHPSCRHIFTIVIPSILYQDLLFFIGISYFCNQESSNKLKHRIKKNTRDAMMAFFVIQKSDQSIINFEYRTVYQHRYKIQMGWRFMV